MISYVASLKNNSLISSAIREKDDITANTLVNDHVNLYKYIKANVTLFSGYDCFIIDISAVDDIDDDIVKAVEMYKTYNENSRIIILSPTQRAGSELLSRLFALGINNIAASFDRVELKEELLKCLSDSGKTFKEALIFKDVKENDSTIAKEELKFAEKVTIGISGASPKIGVTHAAITLAMTLRRRGYMVCLIELNGSGTFQKIRNSFNAKMNGTFFKVDGVDLYPDADKHILAEAKTNAYNFLILDFGNYINSDIEEYFKCHEKIMIVGSKPWEMESLTEFISIYDDDTIISINYIFNFTATENKKEIKKNAKLPNGEKLKVFFADYSPNLFDVHNFASIDSILSDYLAIETKKQKKKGVFGMRKLFNFVMTTSILVMVLSACGGGNKVSESVKDGRQNSSSLSESVGTQLPGTETTNGKNQKNDDTQAPVLDTNLSNTYTFFAQPKNKNVFETANIIADYNIKDESEVITGFMNIKEGAFIDVATYLGDYKDKTLETEIQEVKLSKEQLESITDKIQTEDHSYSIAADLIISDIYGNALSTPIVIDVDRDAPEITAPNLKIEWDVDLDLVNSSETGKIFSTAGEKVIWSIDDGIMPTIRVFNADTGEQIDLPEEEYKYIPTMNILCLSYVGVEYEDNFCGKGLILKDNPSTIVDTTFDTVKDLDAMSSEYNRYQR